MKRKRMRRCHHCNGEFKPKERAQVFCSRRCSGQYRYAHSLRKRCEYCDAEFKPKENAQRFCSLRCAGKYNFAH